MNAVQYAEQQLMVNTVYVEAENLTRSLDEVHNALEKAQARRREIDDEITDAETEVYISERNKHADQSATWLDQHVKHARRKDPTLKALRDERREVAGQVAHFEADADVLKLRIKVKVARMEELGGYLNYLAAAKQAVTQAEKTTRPQGS